MRDTLIELWIIEYFADINFVRAEKDEPLPKWRSIVRFNTVTRLWEPWAMPYERAVDMMKKSQESSKHEWRIRNLDGEIIPGAMFV